MTPEQLSAILEMTPEALVWLEEDGDTIGGSNALFRKRAWGDESRHDVGASFIGLLPEAQHSMWRSLCQKIEERAGHAPQFEVTCFGHHRSSVSLRVRLRSGVWLIVVHPPVAFSSMVDPLGEELPWMGMTLVRDGKVLESSGSALTMGAYQQEEVEGEPAIDFIWPEDRERWQEFMDAPQVPSVTVRGLHASGVPVDVRLRKWPFRIDGEELVALTYTDLAAELRLHSDLWDLSQAVEHAQNGFAMTGVRGALERLNRAWLRMHGWEEQDAQHIESIRRFFPEEVFRGQLVPTMTRAMRDGVARGEFEHVRQDGTRFVSATSIMLIPDRRGDARGLLFIAHDRSRELRAQRDAEVNEEQYRELFSNTSDLILGFDAEGDVLFSNPAAQHALGYEKEQLKRLTHRELLEPGSQPVFSTILSRAGERSLFEGVELVFRCRDGRFLTVEGNLATKTHKVDAVEIFGIFRDITHRKEIDKMKNEFVSVVSHELRTPLTSIRGSLGILESGMMGELPESAREMVEMAHRNSQRLIRLINDILDLEKMKSGKAPIEMSLLHSEDLIEASLAELEPVAREAGVTLKAAWVPSEFQGDRDRLIQVLTNLVSNAIKFSPEGAEVQVVASHQPSQRLRVSVLDRGPGVPEEHKERIFERFHQVDSSDTRSKGGTGLGLAITRALVEQHHGTIGMENRPEGGAEFFFEIPMLYPVGVGEGLAEPSEVELLRKVLLVEDDDIVGNTLRRLLSREGYSVDRARTLQESRQILQQGPPDALLLDIGLPDGSGYDLLTWMAGAPEGYHVPVIVLSGQGVDRDTLSGIPFMVDWLHKPFDGRRLLESLRRLFRAPGQPKVLVVDRDEANRAVIRTHLSSNGVDTQEASTIEEALLQVKQWAPDLFVLDPEGLEQIERLRRGRARLIPMLVYTGHEIDPLVRQQLSLGITRYLTKTRANEEQLVEVAEQMLASILDENPDDFG